MKGRDEGRWERECCCPVEEKIAVAVMDEDEVDEAVVGGMFGLKSGLNAERKNGAR